VEKLPLLAEIANDSKSPVLQATAMLSELAIETAAGDRARQATTAQRVKALVESAAGDALGPAFKTRALLALAEADLRSGDMSEADDLATKALSQQKRGDGSTPKSLEMARAKSMRGIALLERARGPDALTLLSECQSDLANLFGPDAATTSLFSLNLALALERLNHVDEALRVVARAEPILRDALGESAPTYLRVKSMRDRLARASGATSPHRDSVAGEAREASTRRDRSIDFFS
jgi:hypothetical protein